MIDAPMESEFLQRKTFAPLFARNKRGKIIVFKCRVEDYHTHSAIITETGQLGGKMKPKRTPIKSGKNLGKANATTHWTQAVSEAESKWLEKKTEGYKSVKDLERFNNVEWDKSPETMYNFIDGQLHPKYNTDHNNRVKPMLAEKWKKHKHKVKYPVLCQPKYNGVRCRALPEDGRIKLISREGIEYVVNHVIDDLEFIKTADIGLDGELYVHGMQLQDIVSLVKTPQLGTEEVVFMTYDSFDLDMTEEPQNIRLQDMKFAASRCGKSVIESNDRVCADEEDVMDYFRQCRNSGYEGIIVRDLKAHYWFSFRDVALLKVKETMSAEFPIVGFHLNEGHPKEDFVWKCAIPSGETFEVKPHGTIEERVELYDNADDYLGKHLQLDFFEYTNDKKPFHITSVTIRDYE